MKLTATGADLHAAAAWAARAVPARPPVPVLGGLLLRADDHTLTVSGFDYDTAATVTIDATVAEPGVTLVSARLLTAITKTANRDVNVTLDTTGGRAQVRCGRADWTLPGLPVDDYPALPDPGDVLGEIDGAAFADALTRVLPAAGRDATTPFKTGAKLDGDGETLSITCTDGYRLTTAVLDWKPATETRLDVLVPATALATAARTATGTVTLRGGDRVLSVATDTHTLTGRLLDAQYPTWPRLLPDHAEHAALVDAEALISAVAQAQIAADNTSAHHVDLAFTDGEVTVSAAGDDTSARAPADATLTGEPITVCANADYLTTALAAVGGTVRLQFGTNPNRPLLLTGEAAPGVRGLLMPVRRPA